MPTERREDPSAGPLDPQDFQGLVRDALDPNGPAKFNKRFLGEESRGIMSYLSPSEAQRWTHADQVRGMIADTVMKMALQPRADTETANRLFPGEPWGSAGKPGTTPQDYQISPQAGAPPTAGGMLPPGATTGGSNLPPPQGAIARGGYDAPAILPGTAAPGFTGDYAMGPDESGWAPKGPIQDLNQPTVSPVGQQLPQSGLLPGGQSSTSQPIGQDNPLLPRGQGNRLLSPPEQMYFNAQVHNKSLRGFSPYGRGAGSGSAQERLYAHLEGLENGTIEPTYPEQATDIRNMLLSTRTAPTGSIEQQDKKVTVAGKEAELPYKGKQAEATLKKTGVETEGIQARTETENKLRQAKYDNIESQIKLRTKQEELAGSQSGSERMKQKFLMVKVMQIGLAQGLFNETDERDILNYVAPDGMEFVGTPPGKFRQFLDNMGITTPGGDQGIHVAPKGTEAPAQGKADFSDAPPGKKQGQVLNRNGKPVATWSGKAWVPISTK